MMHTVSLRRPFRLASLVAGLFLGGVSLFGAVQANAEEVTLTFVTVNPPTGHVNVNIFHPWAEAINAEGEGIIHIDVKDGTALANFGNIYNRVLDDVIQIGWGLQGVVGGKFPLSEMMALPFLYDNSEDASVAFWRLYETGALDSEYDEVVPLMLTGLAQSPLHFAKPINGPDAVPGKKVQAASKVPADTLSRLGTVPQSLPYSEMYEALQRGTVEGALAGWSSFSPWHLGEVTRYHIDTDLGGAPGMVFMSKAKWDSLSEEAQAILMKHSGEAMSRAFGANTDRVIDEQRQMIAADPAHTIVELSDAQAAAWRAKLEPMIDEWAAERPEGAEVLTQFRAIYADVAAE